MLTKSNKFNEKPFLLVNYPDEQNLTCLRNGKHKYKILENL